jgi:hypothetical protein
MSVVKPDESLIVRIQSFLSRIASWCCQRHLAAQQSEQPLSTCSDPLDRRRIRLAFEFFGLVKRVWGEDIPVKVCARVSSLAPAQWSAIASHRTIVSRALSSMHLAGEGHQDLAGAWLVHPIRACSGGMPRDKAD